jgi:hexosaminidase
VRLEAWYVPAEGGAGTMRLRLVNTGAADIADFQLTLTSIVPLDPAPPTCLVGRRSGCHVLAPPAGTVLGPGDVWEVTATCGHRPRHANDGPASAFVTLADGSMLVVRTGPTARVEVGAAPAAAYRADGVVARAALEAVARRDARLHPHQPAVLAESGAEVVRATIATSLADDAFRLEPTESGWSVEAGSPAAVERALTTLVRAARSGSPVPVGEHAAVHRWRGLHVDVARQFLPPADVEWLIDLAAWHGLNRLHLHLTDDEAWRFPVTAYPALTELGAWRGAGLPIPPLLGSGAEAYGGWYERASIAAWHERAGAAGIVIVPEIDLPGHSFAALAAVPELADRDDTSGAVSVQHFVDNVLDAGVAATWPFLDAVFGELADAFSSPWLHLGGDEVPSGAWSGSPAAQRWAAARDLTGSQQIGLAFARDVIALVRATTGRDVGVWQEAADAMMPGEGYVVGWRSAAGCRALAAAGHDVVAAPAETLYLDMAASPDWHEPGMSWAGHTPVADVAAFDATEGWDAAERERLLGVQACMWTEHVHDRPMLERLLLPRLTAFADAAWPAPSGR